MSVPIILLPKKLNTQFNLFCSFCHRPQSQVPRLLVSNRNRDFITTICTNCVVEATEILKKPS